MPGSALVQCPHCGAVMGAIDRWRQRCRRCEVEVPGTPPPSVQELAPAQAEAPEPCAGMEAGLQLPSASDPEQARRDFALMRELLDEVRHQRNHLERQLSTLQQHYESAVQDRAELTRFVTHLMQSLQIKARQPVEADVRLLESALPSPSAMDAGKNGTVPRRASTRRS